MFIPQNIYNIYIYTAAVAQVVLQSDVRERSGGGQYHDWLQSQQQGRSDCIGWQAGRLGHSFCPCPKDGCLGLDISKECLVGALCSKTFNIMI